LLGWQSKDEFYRLLRRILVNIQEQGFITHFL
jgi:hypothetical protein